MSKYEEYDSIVILALTKNFFPSQFSSVAQLCLTLCDPMDCSTPGLPVHHHVVTWKTPLLRLLRLHLLLVK